MNNHNLRYIVPNGITFISLTCGIYAMMAAISGNFFMSGVLVLASYVLDLFDGAAARTLNASSEFGLQLDSLVDMVSLGVAPAILIFSYLETQGEPMYWVWPSTALVVLAGAYRLARFNLLPPKKTGMKDSVGLTISSGGATLALAVLADLSPYHPDFVPNWLFIPLMISITLLMISRIPYPSFQQVFGHKWATPIGVSGALLLWYWLTFLNAWFVCTIGYLTFSLARAGWQWGSSSK